MNSYLEKLWNGIEICGYSLDPKSFNKKYLQKIYIYILIDLFLLDCHIKVGHGDAFYFWYTQVKALILAKSLVAQMASPIVSNEDI